MEVTLTSPQIYRDLEKLGSYACKMYPINRVDVRAHSVAAGLTIFLWDNCYQARTISQSIFH